MTDTVRLMSKMTAYRAHRQIFSSNLMFYNWSRIARSAKRKAENAEKDLEGRKEKISEENEVEDQTLLCTKIRGVYNRDSRRKDLFYASVLEMGTHFWRKGATWDTMPQTVD